MSVSERGRKTIPRNTSILVSANKKILSRNKNIPSLSWSNKLTRIILLLEKLNYQSYGCENQYSGTERNRAISKDFDINFTPRSAILMCFLLLIFFLENLSTIYGYAQNLWVCSASKKITVGPIWFYLRREIWLELLLYIPDRCLNFFRRSF